MQRFEAGRRDPGEALRPLIDAAAGHPQRAMLLAHHVYARLRPGGVADVETWFDALRGARIEARGEIEVLWESCTGLERRALKLVAERTVPLSGREADIRFGLSKGGSVQAAVDRLVAEGHLVHDSGTRTGWRIVDPFFEDWLRDPEAWT